MPGSKPWICSARSSQSSQSGVQKSHDSARPFRGGSCAVFDPPFASIGCEVTLKRSPPHPPRGASRLSPRPGLVLSRFTTQAQTLQKRSGIIGGHVTFSAAFVVPIDDGTESSEWGPLRSCRSRRSAGVRSVGAEQTKDPLSDWQGAFSVVAPRRKRGRCNKSHLPPTSAAILRALIAVGLSPDPFRGVSRGTRRRCDRRSTNELFLLFSGYW